MVGQEIAEAADTPDDQVFELAQAAAFSGQSLGRPILGSAASIAPADPLPSKPGARRSMRRTGWW